MPSSSFAANSTGSAASCWRCTYSRDAWLAGAVSPARARRPGSWRRLSESGSVSPGLSAGLTRLPIVRFAGDADIALVDALGHDLAEVRRPVTIAA